jgi:hypothetical protein
VIVLERALHIEPRNPTVWHYLGLARFDQGNYSQAEAMAAKSHTLASADRSLRTRNVGLMASAQRAAGKPVSVPSNEPPRSTLERSFATAARTYSDTGYGIERAQSAPNRQRPAADGTAQTSRRVRSGDWRRIDDVISERVRRERAARRGEPRSQSVIVFDGRQFRRYELDEVARRKR